MAQALPVSRLVQVSVTLTPAGAQAQNLSTLLILGSSAVLDSVERYRSYSSIAGVSADFGTSAPEYLAAALWFEQVPQPTTLQIGRWFQAAGSGVLRGAPLTAAQQALSVFTAVASGGFTYTLNGGAPTNVTGISLVAAANLNGVASLITAALSGATMVWNSVFGRFELTSTTTGSTSAVSFLTAPGSGTDLSALLGMRSTSSGAYVAPGLAAETAVAAVTLFDANYGQAWYATTVLAAADSDHLAIAPYIEAANNKHAYGVTTQEAAVLVPSATSDIAYQLNALAYNKTTVSYSSTNPYAVVSYLARIMTTNYNGNNTAITLAFKQEPGIVAENFNTTQANSLQTKACNAFQAFNNGTAIIMNGVQASGVFTDIIFGTDWLAVSLMTAGYNALYTTTTKIPQTDPGMHLLTTTFESVCSQAVINGLLAAGVWNAGGFGVLNTGDYMPKGFYVYAPPVASQSPTLRAQRQSVAFQIAAKLAGAVHDISIAVLVNQ